MAIHVETPTGEATLQALLALVDRLDAVAAADPNVRILLDETDFEHAGLSADDARRVGAAWAATSHARHARVAVVAPDDVTFGMSRLGASHAGAEETIRVFRTRADAAAWLRL